MNQEIKFTCSHCGQKMLVDAAAIGLTVACPGCGKDLVVPAQDTRDELVPSPVRPRSQAVPEQRASLQSAAPTETLPALGASDPTRDLIAATVQNSRLEGQIAEFRQQVKKLRSDVGRVTEERDEAIGQIQQMAPELELAREHLEAYAQSVDSLQQQVLQAEVDVAEARQQLADAQEERTVGLRENQSLQQRIDTQQEELASLFAELTTATGKGQTLEADLVKLRENLTSAENQGETLRLEIAELVKERDSLRRSVSESGLGQELFALREQLATAEKECKRLSLQVRQLSSDVDTSEKARQERDDLIRTLKTELERRSTATTSEAKINNDIEVLRGIIARQNSELEQKHTQLVRFKRARLGVQFVYVMFALALSGLLVLAWKMVTKLKPGSLLDF
jgi:predicted  nucleic acid-binding Zn-ribbon protein